MMVQEFLREQNKLKSKPDTLCLTREEAYEILSALEELQEYRNIEAELKEKYHSNVDIKRLVQYFIETIFKGEKHERFCILTNQEADAWEGYLALGTVEELEKVKWKQEEDIK